jgi:hypothetical protein
LTLGEKKQLIVDLTIQVAQARQSDGRREGPENVRRVRGVNHQP